MVYFRNARVVQFIIMNAILLFTQKVKMAEQKDAVLNSTQDYIKIY